MKYFISISIAAVVVAIGLGLYMVGSPAQERMRRLDEMRVQHLQMIQYQVSDYWRTTKRLPSTLSELSGSVEDMMVPLDPETNASYEYEKVSDLRFRLCAVFATAAESNNQDKTSRPYPAYPMSGVVEVSGWAHGSGRVCFDRTIDLDFFKPAPLPTVKD